MANSHHQLRQQFAHYLAEQRERTLETLRTGPGDAEGVHRARVAIKKTRAAIRLLVDTLTKRTLARQHARLRLLAHAMAGARDASARAAALDQLAVRFRDEVSAAAMARMRRLVARPHSAGGQRERARYRRLIPVAEAAWQHCLRWVDVVTPGRLRRGLAASLKRAQRAFRQARSAPTTARLHRWRKRIKDLLYQSHLLRALGGTMPKRSEHACDELAQCLGTIHDLAQLRSELSGKAGRQDRATVLPLARRFEHELGKMALAFGARMHSPRMRRRLRQRTTKPG